MIVKCCFCDYSQFETIKMFLNHLRFNHSNNLDNFKCGFQNCTREYGTKSSFKNHLYTHINTGTMQQSSSTELDLLEIAITSEPVDYASSISSDLTLLMCTSIDNPSIIEIIKFNLLKLIVKMYNENFLPRSKALEILKTTLSFFQDSLVIIKQNLDSSNSENDTGLSIIEWLSQPDIVKSEYMILKTLRQLGFFVLPKTFIMNKELIPIIQNTETSIVETIHSVKMMPLHDMFFALFNKTSIIDDILKYINYINNLDQNYVYNIIQSKLWTQKVEQINNQDKRTLLLPLIIYFDDFEPNNVLGSRSGSHKVGAVYVKIPCLPVHMQSKISHIYAAMLFYTEDRKFKKFGNSRVLAPLIDELNKLQNVGIELTSHSRFNLIKLIPMFITGDNLGMNSILGFVECFVANYFCRFCNTHRNESNSLCYFEPQELRTVNNYKFDVDIQDPKQTGIKEESIWNSLSNFHVFENMAVDSMHDLAEGVFHYLLLAMLNKFIEGDSYFSIEELNYRIQIFDFGPSVSINKFSQLTPDFLSKTKIKYSASEMKVFFLNLPVLIGDYVPVDNKEWQVYLKLRDIYTIVNIKYCHKELHILLKTLITEFNEMYLEVFDSNLKPKFHFLLHYSYVMEHIGPLHSSCSIRYESKHQEFKRVMVTTACKKNILQTMAMKHQLKFVNTIFQYSEQINKIFEYGPTQNFTNFSFQQKFQFEIYCELDLVNINWFIYNGFLYKKNVVVQYDYYDDDLPVFGLVQSIFTHNNEIHFALEFLENLGFDNHYFGYKIKSSNVFVSISFNNINKDKISHVNILVSNEKFVNWN